MLTPLGVGVVYVGVMSYPPCTNEDDEGESLAQTYFNMSTTHLVIIVIVAILAGQGVIHAVMQNPMQAESPMSMMYEDTDGDGLSDVAEKNDPRLENASPNRTDVYVEVDYMTGNKPTQEQLESVKRAYANASVDNPDGSEGITVHIVVDEAVPPQSNTTMDGVKEYKREYFDHKGLGYHYVLMVNDATKRHEGDSAAGHGKLVGQAQNGHSMVEWREQQVDHTFAHELGHSIGLQPDDFDGVDSRKYSCDLYTSVMNYNCHNVDTLAGEDSYFDDGEFVENNLYTPDRTRLNLAYLDTLI